MPSGDVPISQNIGALGQIGTGPQDPSNYNVAVPVTTITTLTNTNPINGTFSNGPWVTGTFGYPSQPYQQVSVIKDIDDALRRFGCETCKKQRKGPSTGAVPANQGFPPVPIVGNGFCGTCKSPLVELRCDCGEPLYDHERFCRACSTDNYERLRAWKIHEPAPSAMEQEERGNTSSDGDPFRGIRDE